MPVYLTLTAGPDAGRQIAVTKKFVRVGSAASCDVRVNADDVAEHLLTLGCEEGRWVAYNRSDASLAVGGQPLPPGSSLEWREGQTLELRGHAILQLDLQPRDPETSAPSPLFAVEDSPLAVPEDFEAGLAAWSDGAGEDHDGASLESLKKAGQLLVIILCFALCGVLLLTGGVPDSAESENGVSLEAVLQKTRTADDDAIEVRNAVISLLRTGYRAEVSNNAALAREQYYEILALLGTHGGASRSSQETPPEGEPETSSDKQTAGADDDWRALTYEYAKSRLESLKGR